MMMKSGRAETIRSVLYEMARQCLGRAYSPYSGFRVAAAVLTSDGEYFSGCNVENASYGGTVCAERVAIWKAISEGAREISAVLVMTEAKDPWPPCGLCRQVMIEFAKPKTSIYVANTKGKIRTYTLGQLLPKSFAPENLNFKK